MNKPTVIVRRTVNDIEVITIDQVAMLLHMSSSCVHYRINWVTDFYPGFIASDGRRYFIKSKVLESSLAKSHQA